MPAPCLLNSTVFVCSEKTLPSMSLPTRRIAISLGIRLLRRTPSGGIRSLTLRGRSSNGTLGNLFPSRTLWGMTRKRQGSRFAAKKEKQELGPLAGLPGATFLARELRLFRIRRGGLALAINSDRFTVDRLRDFTSRSKLKRGTLLFLALCLQRRLRNRRLLRLHMNRPRTRSPRVGSIEMIRADFGLGLASRCQDQGTANPHEKDG